MNSSISLRGLSFCLLLLFIVASDIYAQNFVYVNNNTSGSNTVSAFSVGAGGSLSPVAGSPFATGGAGSGDFLFAASRARVCAVGNRLYVSNSASNNVSGFDVNPTTGGLSLVPGSPFATGGQAGNGISLDCTPDGRYVIAVNAGSANVSCFSVGANGALTAVPGSPFPLVGSPAGTRVSPDGRFLCVALLALDRVAMFTIGADGALTPVPGSTFASPAGGNVAGVEIDCSSSFVYASQATTTGTNVDVFRIGADGALTLVQTSNNAAGNNSNPVLLSADGRFLYISNQGSNTISVFAVASDGTLSSVPGSPFPNTGGSLPQQMATDQTGAFLYVNNGGGSVSVFSVASNGSVTPVTGSPFAAGSGVRPGIAAFPPARCCSLTCPSDITTCNDAGQSGAVVAFDPTTGDCGTVVCDPPSGSFFPIGSTTVTCVSEGGKSCSFNITVEDCAGPELSCAVAASVLWPANQELVNVGLTVDTGGSGLGQVQVTVFSDGDDDEETGDARQSPDATDIAPGTLRLRAERRGNGGGRVYLIVVRATDERGAVAVCCATVVVPHNQKKASRAAVQAQAAAARAFCEANGGAAPPGYYVVGDGPVIGTKQ